MGVGFVRPHTPLIVPQKYFDLFPIESIKLPKILKADAEDTFKYTVTSKEDDRSGDRGTKMYDSCLLYTSDAALADAAGKVRAAASTRQTLANRTNDLERRIASAEQNLAGISLDELAAVATEAATALTGAEVVAEHAATALATAETALANNQTAFDLSLIHI